MKLIVQKAADRQIDKVYAYGEQAFGIRVAEELHERILQSLRTLTAQPYIGKVEPLLAGRRYIYRSLVVHKYFKLIYYIDESRQTIYIAALWDTRREPLTQAQTTR